MKDITQTTMKIKEVERGTAYWILHLEDGTTAGLPLLFQLPDETVDKEVTLYTVDVKDATGEHPKVVGIKLDPPPIIDIGAFEALVGERDSLRATAAALRQQMGFKDAGDGLFLKPPGAPGIPGMPTVPDAPVAMSEPPANNGARGLSFTQRLRQAARMLLEE